MRMKDLRTKARADKVAPTGTHLRRNVVIHATAQCRERLFHRSGWARLRRYGGAYVSWWIQEGDGAVGASETLVRNSIAI